MLVNDTEGEEVYFMVNTYVKPVALTSQIQAIRPDAGIITVVYEDLTIFVVYVYVS